MSDYEPPKGHWQTFATVLIFGGLAMSVVFDEIAWIAIAIMLTGLAISLSLLFIQWRGGRAASGDSPDPMS